MSEEKPISKLEKEVTYCVWPKGHPISWETYNIGKEWLDDSFFEVGMICDDKDCKRAYGSSKLKLVYKN